jgi:hypothetical protein
MTYTLSDTCVYYAEGKCFKLTRMHACALKGDFTCCGLIDSVVDGVRMVYAVKVSKKVHNLPKSILDLFCVHDCIPACGMSVCRKCGMVSD